MIVSTYIYLETTYQSFFKHFFHFWMIVLHVIFHVQKKNIIYFKNLHNPEERKVGTLGTLGFPTEKAKTSYAR